MPQYYGGWDRLHLAPSSAVMCLYHRDAFGLEEEGGLVRALYTARSSREAWYLQHQDTGLNGRHIPVIAFLIR